MVIYLGADHNGLELKESIKLFLNGSGHEVKDLGANNPDPRDDYPDFANAVAGKVSRSPGNSRGILVCGSGTGMDITANRYDNVRSVLGLSPEQVTASRHDDDVNVLSLAADYTDPEKVRAMVTAFLNTDFDPDARFTRRLKKIPRGKRIWKFIPF